VRALLTALGLVIVTACASSPPAPPPATNEQKQQATHDFLKCAIQHQPEVDDGVSDVNAVALALTIRCINEYDAVTDVWFAGSRDRQLIREWKQKRATLQDKVEASLGVVLAMRKGAKPNPNF